MIRATMEQRYVELDRNPDATFSRLVLVMEEVNTFYIDSVDHWEEIKEKGAPKTPRIFRDLSAILNKGRQVNVNVISVFQRLDAAVAGGGAARDQYGMKILARFSPQAWKMLVDTYPRPKSNNHPGRGIVSDGSGHRAVQMAFALDPRYPKNPRLSPEALSFATGPRREPAAPSVPGPGVPGPSTALDLGGQGTNVPRTRPEEASEDVPIGLATACELDILTASLAAVRKARTRDPEFPAPAGREGQELLYWADDLRRWQRNRARLSIIPPETGIAEAGN